MTVRQRLEQIERDTLSPHATLSAESRGREHPLSECDIRTAFQRDRDRIIHCKSFRRLKYKTQMIMLPEDDHARTRLTHTLEVSQVARSLSRALRLNEDLTEAIAMGHDLGHTPFGHIGERLLDKVLPGGFMHREQSLRVVERLERGTGLNLTWEVRDGILHHSGKEDPATLEAMVVHMADRIAYINHDIDDAIRAGMLQQEMLPREATDVLGKTHGERIDTMIRDIVAVSAGEPYVRMSEQVQDATDALRDFLFENIYYSPETRVEETKAHTMLEHLANHLFTNSELIPQEYQGIAQSEGVRRAVCDYIAGMTDRYVCRCYAKWLLPSSFEL